MISVKTLTGSLRRRVQRLFGPHVEISWISSPDLVSIAAEPDRVEEIVFDLVCRARNKALPGGRVAIEWAPVHVEDRVAGVNDLPAGTYVMLELTCWMPSDAQPWVFQPAASDILGDFCLSCDLSELADKIRVLGGQVCEYNEPGRALTIRAFFPSARNSNFLTDFAVSDASKKLQILLVEDERFVRDVACEFLELEGYLVLSARTPKEAMQLVEKNGPVHLLLTDVVMPGMNGRELSKRLTSSNPDLKTIYMSGYSDHSAVNFEGEDLKRPFIQKPFTLESLIEIVKAAIGSPVA